MSIMQLSQLRLFCIVVAKRFMNDGCFTRAAGLSYTTLLAIAPVLALAFAVLSMFPTFQGMEDKIHEVIFKIFVPTASATVGDYFTRFIGNATHSTAFGVISLTVTSVLLLLTIQNSFDYIWSSATKRTLLSNILTFWATLTMGPLLLGTSLSVSSYLFAKAQILNIPGAMEANSLFLRAFPSFTEIIAFFLLYTIIPNTFVRWKHALVGATFTTFIFEILKLGFEYYVTTFPFYQVLYGTLATVPIFLIWLYLTWAAALLGAEIVSTLPEYSTLTKEDIKPSTNLLITRILMAGISILKRLFIASRNPDSYETSASLIHSIPMRHAVIHEAIERLRNTRYLVKTEDGKFILNRDLEFISFRQLCKDMDVKVEPQHISEKLGFEGTIVRKILQNQDLKLEEYENITIKDILQRAQGLQSKTVLEDSSFNKAGELV